jgi:hypothetical protein
MKHKLLGSQFLVMGLAFASSFVTPPELAQAQQVPQEAEGSGRQEDGGQAAAKVGLRDPRNASEGPSRLSQEAGLAETRKGSERIFGPRRARGSRSFPVRSSVRA